MAGKNLPDNTFGEVGLGLAGDALLIVHRMVTKAVGEATGPAVMDKLSDLAMRLRNEEKSDPELPGVAVDWPRDLQDESSGEMGFHVAAGGSEYDGVTVHWKAGPDGKPAFTYHYDGRDELYECETREE